MNELVSSLREKVSRSEVNTEKGLSLLELKHNLMLRQVISLFKLCHSRNFVYSFSLTVEVHLCLCSYVINLVQLMLLKVKGQSLLNQPVVHRLTEIRTVRQ